MDIDFITAVLRLAIFLPLVILLAYVSLKYGLGKVQKNSASSHMQVVDRVSLGPKAGLLVVKVAEEYFLLAVSEQQIQIIKELPGYPPVESPSYAMTGLDKVVSQWRASLTSKNGKRGNKS